MGRGDSQNPAGIHLSIQALNKYVWHISKHCVKLWVWKNEKEEKTHSLIKVFLWQEDRKCAHQKYIDYQMVVTVKENKVRGPGCASGDKDVLAAFYAVAWEGLTKDNDMWQGLEGIEGTDRQMQDAPGRRESKLKGPHVGVWLAC